MQWQHKCCHHRSSFTHTSVVTPVSNTAPALLSSVSDNHAIKSLYDRSAEIAHGQLFYECYVFPLNEATERGLSALGLSELNANIMRIPIKSEETCLTGILID